MAEHPCHDLLHLRARNSAFERFIDFHEKIADVRTNCLPARRRVLVPVVGCSPCRFAQGLPCRAQPCGGRSIEGLVIVFHRIRGKGSIPMRRAMSKDPVPLCALCPARSAAVQQLCRGDALVPVGGRALGARWAAGVRPVSQRWANSECYAVRGVQDGTF